LFIIYVFDGLWSDTNSSSRLPAAVAAIHVAAVCVAAVDMGVASLERLLLLLWPTLYPLNLLAFTD
jgi:hypothetical protein